MISSLRSTSHRSFRIVYFCSSMTQIASLILPYSFILIYLSYKSFIYFSSSSFLLTCLLSDFILSSSTSTVFFNDMFSSSIFPFFSLISFNKVYFLTAYLLYLFDFYSSSLIKLNSLDISLIDYSLSLDSFFNPAINSFFILISLSNSLFSFCSFRLFKRAVLSQLSSFYILSSSTFVDLAF